MKKLFVAATAAALAVSFAASSEAATHKQRVSASMEASCKAQAAKKFSAIHFLKRRHFVNDCVAKHGSMQKNAKAKDMKAKSPATTGQAPTGTTTGQTPKAQ